MYLIHIKVIPTCSPRCRDRCQRTVQKNCETINLQKLLNRHLEDPVEELVVANIELSPDHPREIDLH